MYLTYHKGYVVSSTGFTKLTVPKQQVLENKSVAHETYVLTILVVAVRQMGQLRRA